VTRCRILFAPGAGAPSTSAWMSAWAARLATLGEVRGFDYAYRLEGRKRPDPHARLLEAHRLAAARFTGDGPLVYAGKSMGSRIGCHLALEQPPRALVCFGYPLRSPSGKSRDEVLVALRTPVLFLQGTRDPLCPLDDLAHVRKRMSAPNELHVVEEGDHSLEVTKRWLTRNGSTQEAVDAAILGVVASFLASHAR
jgi:predicted alpha/beta-hydrolase family hydrolase